jgi:hypothetical protein
MGDQAASPTPGRTADKVGPCGTPFLLCQLMEGQKDKLGHEVIEILWIGQNYAIYCSEKGMYVQFADTEKEAAEQRSRFTEISPEICELRYLTPQMQSAGKFRLGRPRESLYDHNIAQAMMLVMENKLDDGKQLAQQTLKMAVQRVTNDNTVRYLTSGLLFGISAVVICFIICLLFLPLPPTTELRALLIAAMSGAIGAMLSVATRLQSFQLQPCNQSNMNRWMSITRIGIGLIAGPILLLLSHTIFSEPMRNIVVGKDGEWQGIVILGLIAGFAERLLPNLLQRTADKIEAPTPAGTPVQAVRRDTNDLHSSTATANP